MKQSLARIVESHFENEPFSSLTHFLGAGFSIAALVLLIVKASSLGSAKAVVSYAIFASMMILLYAFSGSYHLLAANHHAKELMRKLDHAGIFLLIAGTYTPISLVALQGAWGWSIFGVIWGLAIVGVALKLSLKKFPSIVSVPLYLVMGWLIVIAMRPLLRSLSSQGLLWLVLGGVLYSLGVIFFALGSRITRGSKWFGMHEIFHLFVMAGSFCHFWLMYLHLL